jgi:uncharacterized repeat protein (TIGR03847 family)
MTESASFEFGKPDLFTAGAVGPPGQRVFYLQAREDEALVTLKCEKEQVRALAEYLARLLERLGPVPPTSEDLALLEPVTAAWAVGSIGVAYDEDADRVVLVIEEIQAEDEDDAEGEEDAEAEAEEEPEAEEDVAIEPAAAAREAGEEAEAQAEDEGEAESGGGASARIRLTRAQTAAFVERARALVRAGRPTCRLCGRPMNPAGHRCARSNGHRVD